MPLLSEAEIEDIRGMVAEVQDVNLRNKILYAIIKQVSFKKMRVKQKMAFVPSVWCSLFTGKRILYCLYA